jgi:protein HIRA/HIR1
MVKSSEQCLVWQEVVFCSVLLQGRQGLFFYLRWKTSWPLYRRFFSKKRFFVCRSPDGFSLLACSNDGTVSSFTFDENELGVMLTKPEMDVILKERYGDLKWGKRLAIAESPAQLFLEQAATLANNKIAAPGANGHLQAPEGSGTGSLNQAKPSVNGAVANGQREGQQKPAPANRMLPPVAPQGSPSRIQLGPVKQTEERRPDGRRRIIPQALRPMTGPSVPQPVWSSPPQEQSTGLVGMDDLQRSASAPEPNRDVSQPGVGGDNRVRIAPTPLGVKRPAEAATQSEASKKPRVAAEESAMDRATQAVVARTGPLLSVPGFDAKSAQAISGRLETRRITPVPDSATQAAPSVTARVDINQTQAPVITVPRVKDGLLAVRVSGTDQDGGPPLVLESRDGSGGAAASSELVCCCGGKVRWKDRVRGKVSALAGNSDMWAAVISDGSLIVYSSAGRRVLPPLQLGAPAAFLVVGPGEGDRRWRLMVVTTGGRLFLWDLQKQECLAQVRFQALRLVPESLFVWCYI